MKLANRIISYDTTPSILSQPLPDRESSEPQAKRHKAENGTGAQSSNTILTRLSSKTYTDLDDVLKDIDTAVSAIKAKVQAPNGVVFTERSQSEVSSKASAFKKRAHELVTREKAFSASKANAASAVSNTTANGNSSVKSSTEINVGSNNSKTVLTLYGSAPQPRQLFSSFQAEDGDGEKKDLMQTLRRAPLPPGISTTDIVSIPFNNLVEDNKRDTLGEAFPTPANVPVLQPPKPSKVANTRSSTVGWYQPIAADQQRRTGTYFTQNITPGVWLDYSNASPPQSGKKKQRDRAMSLGGAKAPQIEAEPAESEAAKLEAVFRSVYSGFAPTKDDSAAVAPTGVMDRIWWQQVGKRNFERIVEIEADPESTTSKDVEPKSVVDEDEELKGFQALVDNWESDTVDPTRLPVEARYEKSFEEKTVDEILEGISELLETLSSFQRKRHLSLNSSNRPVGLLAAPDTSTLLGTPTKPTDSEQNTYEIIKAQLKMMIQSLPPYAVAKLNGDQLADLSISPRIEIQLDNYRGVLEEDEITRPKVSTPSITASRPSTSTVHRNSPSALYGNQYSTSRPPTAAPHQYYGASTPVRAAPTLSRAPSTSQVPYRAPQTTAAPYRPQAYGTPGYPQPNPRPVQHQYPQTSGAQYMATPPTQGYMRPAPTQGYQSAPQSAPPAVMNGRYPSQPTYPHQAQGQNGIDYHRYTNGSQAPRQSSPPNPMYGQSTQPSQTQVHQAYSGQSTPTPNMMQNRQQYTQNQVPNGSTPQATPGQYNQPRQTTGYSTFMSQEQQQLMLDRQRAHLANQQRQAAQAAVNTGSGSPSTPAANGGSAVAAGL